MTPWRPWRRAPTSLLEARTAYDRLAAVYPPEPHNPLMELEQQALLELLPPVAGQRVLDVGCGSGRYLRQLAAAGPAALTGCDLSHAMLTRARRAGCVPHPGLVQAEAATLPFAAASFDLLVCGLVLGHLADLGGALREFARVLTPGAVALWSDLHPAGTLVGWRRDFDDGSGRRLVVRQHLHLYSDHLAACRAAGLVIEDLREPRLRVAHPQQGWPAALVVRARKLEPRVPPPA